MDIEALKLLFNMLGLLLASASYMLGLYLCGAAMWMKYGQITPGNRSNNPNSSAWTFVSGVLLILFPVVYRMTMNTFSSKWDNGPAIYAIDKSAIADLERDGSALYAFLPEHSVFILAMFIYGIGLYAYVKGLYLFRYAGTMGNDGRTQGGRAFGHFVGGIAVMNIQFLSCAFLGLFFKLNFC